MTKKFLLIMLAVVITLTGCSSGVSQEEYDALLAENEQLKKQLAQNEKEPNIPTEIVQHLENDSNTTAPSVESDFIYVNNGTEVQINGYKGNGGNIAIPNEIEGSVVTRIAPNAFKESESITSVVLPEKLQYIGDNAFYGLENLTGVLVIPETVTVVEGHAFQSTRLTGLVIKSSCDIKINAFANITTLEFIYVEEGCSPVIGTSAFSYAEELSAAVFPNTMVEIKDETFKACNNMVIYTQPGSFSEKYANKNFISVNTKDYEAQKESFINLYGKRENSSGVSTECSEPIPTESVITEASSETTDLSKTNISEAETFTMFNAAFNDLEDLLDDFSDTLEYDNFSSVAEIEDYETLWGDMSNKAKTIQTTFLENAPPPKYKELWDDYGACMGQISLILAQGTEMDTNQDGSYTGVEMTSHISNIRDEFVEEASEAVDIFKKFIEQYDGKTITNSNDSDDNDQSRQAGTTPKEYCTVCSKSASRTYTNPFSNEKEKYCETHYQEIIDITNMLEEDYQQSTSSNSSYTDSYSGSSARHTDSEAFSCAKAIVKSKLKSPSTAKFCWITDATITHLGNGEYMVTGWVDAQNSFGATIRQDFVVVYTATENGYKNGTATLS